MTGKFKKIVPAVVIASPETCFCPACGSGLAIDAKWCGACGFTGAKTLELFPVDAPPMMPLFDAAGLFDAAAVQRVESARAMLKKRFPQFRVNVWTVDLPADQSLPVFGFWLLNACPLHSEETTEDRKWTLLLLLNVGTGEVAAISGYSVERWLHENDLKWMLERLAKRRTSRGLPAALTGFYQDYSRLLKLAWRQRVSKRKLGRSP